MPQPPCWQPAFGLVMSSSSRRTCRSGVSGGLTMSCSTPLTISFMRAPVGRGLRGRASAARCGGSRRTRRASSTGSTSSRSVGGVAALPRQRGTGRPSGRRPADADAQVAAVRARARPRRRRSHTNARGGAAGCSRRTRAKRSYSTSSTSRPARSPARKSSIGSVRSPPAPVERDARAERDQRRAEVAALAVGAGRRADVAADRRAAAHLAVGDVAGERREQLVGGVRRARATGTIAPIATRCRPRARSVEPASDGA